jgi:hypothetical protein
MDPFIIIKNHRQILQRQAEENNPPPRLFLRELDPNALAARAKPKIASRLYCEEDKENYAGMLDFDFEKNIMNSVPKPNNRQLINYEDYDFNY